MKKPDQTSLVHPSHPMPEEVSEALAALREESRASAERDFQLAKLARPTKKERRAIAELRGLEHKPGLRELGSEYADRIQEAEIGDPVATLELPALDIQPRSPLRSDPSFWWARTDWS